MPIQTGNAQHTAAIREGKRKAALYHVTDPLWRAIAVGNSQEVARLQAKLSDVVKRDKRLNPERWF